MSKDIENVLATLADVKPICQIFNGFCAFEPRLESFLPLEYHPEERPHQARPATFSVSGLLLIWLTSMRL